MIINESIGRDDYDEIEIKNPQKFISAIGGIMDSGVRESLTEDVDRQKRMEQQIVSILKQNKMSTPPTVQEIKRNDNKIKVPWFLVGTLLSKAKEYGLEKKRNK